MKPPVNLSDEELSEYADAHLAYELDMLRWSGSILYAYNIAALRGFSLESPLSQPIANALLESFAIHSRNLVDFLYLRNHYKKDRASDIVVEDYLDDRALQRTLPPISELLRDAKKKADKQVAHLACERLRYGVMDKSWMYAEITRELYTAFEQAVSHMPVSKVGRLLPTLVSSDRSPFTSVRGDQVQTPDGSVAGISFILDSR